MKPQFTVREELVCVMEGCCRCYLATRSRPLRQTILIQVLIFTDWCIFLTVGRVWGVPAEFWHQTATLLCSPDHFTQSVIPYSLFHTRVTGTLPKNQSRGFTLCVYSYIWMQSATFKSSGAWARISDPVVSHVWLLWGGFRCIQEKS